MKYVRNIFIISVQYTIIADIEDMVEIYIWNDGEHAGKQANAYMFWKKEEEEKNKTVLYLKMK